MEKREQTGYGDTLGRGQWKAEAGERRRLVHLGTAECEWGCDWGVWRGIPHSCMLSMYFASWVSSRNPLFSHTQPMGL
jgi:hypothetical protein